MDDLGQISGAYTPFLLNQGEVKEKQEADVKEKPLPFDVIKMALANLNSETVLTQAELREKVTHVLTDLSNDDVSILEKLPSREKDPILHESIEALVATYKQIKDTNAELVYDLKNERLKKISSELGLLGDIDGAIEIANTISSNILKSYAMSSICTALLKVGNLDRAVEVANFIRMVPSIRIARLKKICEAFIAAGNIDKAIALSNTIPEPDVRADILLTISATLRTIGNIDKATTIAKIAANNINLAIKNAHSLPESDISKGIALRNIVNTLINAGNIDKALEVTSTMSEPINQDSALGSISQHFTDIGNVNQAIEIANKITDVELKDITLMMIVKSNIGNVDKAVELAHTIISLEYREQALTSVINSLLKTVNNQTIIKAREVVNTETDVTVKANLQTIINDILDQAPSGG